MNAEEPFIDSEASIAISEERRFTAEDQKIDESGSINTPGTLFINAKHAKSVSEYVMFDVEHAQSPSEDLIIDATDPIEASTDPNAETDH